MTASHLNLKNPIDPDLFKPEAISAETHAFNSFLVKTLTAIPNWWDVGAQKVREASARGDGPFPLAPKSGRARTISITGRGGHNVPLRVVAPDRPTGVYLHIHGGGWVLGASDLQDAMLERVAQNTGLACVSVEYRLAPENPYPAGPDDCEIAALWVVKNAKSEFGSDVLAIGGESAGAHLVAVTLIRMRDRHGFTGFRCANLVFGAFDMSMTPSQKAFGNERLVLRTMDMEHFIDAFLPGVTNRRDPDISPLYADLKNLPPALLTVGTRDLLLDDSLFMCQRWLAAGNPAEIAIYPGATHGFTSFSHPMAAKATERIDAFLKDFVS